MKSYGTIVIGVAVIWAVVIIASTVILRGTPYWGQMFPLLGAGAAASIIVVGWLRKRRNS